MRVQTIVTCTHGACACHGSLHSSFSSAGKAGTKYPVTQRSFSVNSQIKDVSAVLDVDRNCFPLDVSGSETGERQRRDP